MSPKVTETSHEATRERHETLQQKGVVKYCAAHTEDCNFIDIYLGIFRLKACDYKLGATFLCVCFLRIHILARFYIYIYTHSINTQGRTYLH